MLKLSVLIFLIFPSLSFAEEAKKSKVSKVRVFQMAKPDTAAYAEPSFDARIIVRLKKGQKLYGLKKKVEGVGGFGLFYKVRLKKGLHAYILDTAIKGFKPDMETVEVEEEQKEETGGGISGRANITSDTEGDKADPYAKHSIPYAKSYGMVLSFINYGLDFKGTSRKSTELYFGAKISGKWFDRLAFPLDISLLYSPSSPALFDSFTQEHQGSSWFAEVSMPLEWKKGPKWSVFGQLGGVISRHDFLIKIGNENQSSGKMEFGVVAGGGGGYRFGRYIAKLELKYYLVGANHMGFQASVQRIF